MKNRGIADRVADLGDRARERVVHSRMERLDKDNERLRTEVSLLRGDLNEERSSLKDALKGLEARKVTVKKSRRPHLIRTLLIAGGAYVLGTRDGHERYDQIVQKGRSLMDGFKRGAREREAVTHTVSGSSSS